NANLKGVAYMQIVPNVGASFGFPPVLGAPDPIKNYAIHWRGRIVAPQTRLYTFYIQASKSLINLEINNKTVINNLQATAGEQSVTMQLSAGQYNFRLQYINQTAAAGNVAMLWSGPDITKEP